MKIRAKCLHDSVWHYIYEEQEILNINIVCIDHPNGLISDFVILILDVIV